ncbi:hypothetical protein AWZ03_014662, partial [Drosophila navojoa]
TAGPTVWPIKSDLIENARREAEERDREREIREREQRERDRQRREREERERKEKEDKLKREQQEREKERERERERERKERERREIERREVERERLLQQQRINESNKQAIVASSSSTPRDRSPHRIIGELNTEIRIKEEHSRTKDEQDNLLMRASAAVSVGDPRYHPSTLVSVQPNAAVAAAHHHANFLVSGRHGLPPPTSHITRNMMPPSMGISGPLTHFGPPGPTPWGIDPYRDPYAPILRYNPIMEAAFRHEAEERQKALSMYAAQSAAHLRSKEPSPIPPPSKRTKEKSIGSSESSKAYRLFDKNTGDLKIDQQGVYFIKYLSTEDTVPESTENVSATISADHEVIQDKHSKQAEEQPDTDVNEAEQPRRSELYDDRSGCVLKLKMSLYSLKQAGRVWSTKLEGVLTKMEYRAGESKLCLCTKCLDEQKIDLIEKVDEGHVTNLPPPLATVEIQ